MTRTNVFDLGGRVAAVPRDSFYPSEPLLTELVAMGNCEVEVPVVPVGFDASGRLTYPLPG